MVKNKTFVISLIVFVLVFLLFNLATVYFFGLPLSPVVMTGKAVNATGLVEVRVELSPRIITIYSPENATYNESNYTCVTGVSPKCDNYMYFLYLNVSADFVLEDPNNWRYWLYDLKHDVYVEENTIFTPYTVVPFVRWGNLLIVSAEEHDLDWVNASVVFTIDVPNSAPLIQNFSDKIFACEGEAMGNLNDSNFNVFDIDEEDFFIPDVNYVIDGGNIFGLDPSSKTSDTITPFQIISVIFDKFNLGDHVKTISVIDSEGLTDTNVTNITVIEVNNVPVIYVGAEVDPNGIGAQTIWMSGANSTFVYQMNVVDVEDGNSSNGGFSFNLTGDPGFIFNESTGAMSYVPQAGDEDKTFSVTVCAIDNALASVHENFSVCSGRGFSSGNQTICDDFSLTITGANRPPVIENYSPTTLNFSVLGTTANLFSVEVSDADMVNAYPDIDWYVDGVLRESNENKSSDDFSYTFGCEVSGNHSVMIVTSDGLLNDSVTWNINVTNVDCPVDLGRGGGGGGGGLSGGICNEQWACHGWGLCQNAERSFDAEVLSSEDYSSTRDLCAQNLFEDIFCGFQLTRCFDLEKCNNTEVRIPKPSESRVCYFTENPNCIDGITNCHDGDCELLVDCGGPCDPCPTCSDGKRNQGEKGVDCGGPCPYACEAERPFSIISFILIGLLLLMLLLLIYILYKVFKIIKHRFFLAKEKREGGRALGLNTFYSTS